jgi:hypothetical protein
MSFKELNNNEWVFIYLYLNQVKYHYDEIIENKGIGHLIKGPSGNNIEFFQRIDQTIIDKVIESDKYQLISSITDKVHPIYDIIEDSDPTLVSKISDEILSHAVERLLNSSMDELDDFEDEDM